jgi:hypothetical protein
MPTQRTTQLSLLLLIAATLAAGCVRYYRTDKLRATLGLNLQQTDQFLGGITLDYEKKKARVAKRKISSSTHHSNDQRLLGQLAGKIAQIKMKRGKLKEFDKRFAKLVGECTTVRSDSPMWEPFSKLEREYLGFGDTIHDDIRSYNLISSDLERSLNTP